MTYSHDPATPNDPRRRFVRGADLLALAASPWAAFAAAETCACGALKHRLDAGAGIKTDPPSIASAAFAVLLLIGDSGRGTASR